MANYSYQRLSYQKEKIDKLLRNSEMIRQLIGADGFDDPRFDTLVGAINLILANELTLEVAEDSETAIFSKGANWGEGGLDPGAPIQNTTLGPAINPDVPI